AWGVASAALPSQGYNSGLIASGLDLTVGAASFCGRPSRPSIAHRMPRAGALGGRWCAESVRPYPPYPGALPRAPAPPEVPMEWAQVRQGAFILYDILVTGIELPPAIVAAINRKIEQYYIAEEYKFRVEREKRESERKSIEAEGIRDFQQIVSQGISE